MDHMRVRHIPGDQDGTTISTTQFQTPRILDPHMIYSPMLEGYRGDWLRAQGLCWKGFRFRAYPKPRPYML